ncbi:MAG: hypothetical protein ACJAR2_002446 [Ilumatobacter sp.]|jgi:hypothetical protein
MNVFDTIQTIRPKVEPMPLVNRRKIRESLLGVGHEGAARSISARSESGAVVSTAPHGTRKSIRKPPRSGGSVPKMAAGLLLVGAVAGVGWSYVNRDTDAGETTAPTVPTTTTETTTTIPPTVAPPLVRTGVTLEEPLVLPDTLLGIDEVSVALPSPGSSALLMTAPDRTTLWMAEFDGTTPNAEGLDVRQFGSIGVGVPSNRADDGAASYQLQVPCGVVLLNDAIGQPLDRPEVVSLFESMSIDGDATIDLSKPPGWSILDIGDSQVSFTTQFQVPGLAETFPVRLVQIPDGSFPQLAFGGRQLQTTTFLGGPAFIDGAPTNPDMVSIYWKDGPTAFNVSSPNFSFADLERFVESFEPVTVAEWSQQFDVPVPEALTLDTQCAPQPNFGQTLDP